MFGRKKPKDYRPSNHIHPYVCEDCRAFIDCPGKTLHGINQFADRGYTVFIGHKLSAAPDAELATKYWCPACADLVPEAAVGFVSTEGHFDYFVVKAKNDED